MQRQESHRLATKGWIVTHETRTPPALAQNSRHSLRCAGKDVNSKLHAAMFCLSVSLHPGNHQEGEDREKAHAGGRRASNHHLAFWGFSPYRRQQASLTSEPISVQSGGGIKEKRRGKQAYFLQGGERNGLESQLWWLGLGIEKSIYIYIYIKWGSPGPPAMCSPGISLWECESCFSVLSSDKTCSYCTPTMLGDGTSLQATDAYSQRANNIIAFWGTGGASFLSISVCVCVCVCVCVVARVFWFSP